MKKLFLLLSLFAGFSSAASAASISTLNALAATSFRLLSEDLGSALSYKPVTPPTPLGLTGFDVGLEVTATDISKSTAALSAASGGGNSISTLVVPKLHVAKGLPFGIDLAAFISSIPTTNIKLIGGEFRFALLSGGIAIPAVGLRLAATQLSGVEQLSFNTKSVDISISKGFLLITPYIGIGQVFVKSEANIAGLGGIVLRESFSQSKVFAGANLNLGLINFALEGDKTGGATSYGFKVGFRW